MSNMVEFEWGQGQIKYLVCYSATFYLIQPNSVWALLPNRHLEIRIFNKFKIEIISFCSVFFLTFMSIFQHIKRATQFRPNFLMYE